MAEPPGRPDPTRRPAPTGLGRARWGLATLALSAFIAVTTEILPVGLLPEIGAGFGVGASTVGLLVSLYALMVAVLAVPLTLATARLPRKPLIAGTLAAYAVANGIVAFAPDFGALAAGRALGGLTHALFFSIAIGYAARLVPAAQTGRALAFASAGASAGFVLGVPLSTLLGTALGWRAAFTVLAAATALALVLVVLVLPAVDARAPRLHADGPRPRRRSLVAVVGVNLLVFTGHYALFTYVSPLLQQAGATPALVGPILLAFGAAGLVALLSTGRWFDRHGRGMLLAFVAAIVLGLLGAGAGAGIEPAGAAALAAVVAAGLVWNGGFGPVSSLFQAAAVGTRVVTPELAGAWINATSNVGIAAGAAIGGLVLDAGGLPPVAAVAAGFVVAGLAVILLARRAFPRAGAR